MFTGIIETLGKIEKIEKDKDNINFSFSSSITNELKIDQSLSHDGVCLTVVNIQDNQYTVTAIQETLNRSALKNWSVGAKVNLERALKLGDRLDGHMVLGHVDEVAKCESIEEMGGSWIFKFSYNIGDSLEFDTFLDTYLKISLFLLFFDIFQRKNWI